jgi:hypothetical protein
VTDNDPFLQLTEARNATAQKAGTLTTTGTPAEPHAAPAPPPPPPAPAPAREEEALATDAREILVGIYVDGTMDAALREFEDVRVGGTGARPSRSSVGNWLLTLGLEAARTKGLTSVPASFVKKRRRT